VLPDDLLQLHPDPSAHAWSRTQHFAAPSSPASTRSHARTPHAQLCAPNLRPIETPRRLPQNVHTSTPQPIPPD